MQHVPFLCFCFNQDRFGGCEVNSSQVFCEFVYYFVKDNVAPKNHAEAAITWLKFKVYNDPVIREYNNLVLFHYQRHAAT